jgi:FKBP-type peptidyl-prolyl cis-trans isomerase SlyD
MKDTQKKTLSVSDDLVVSLDYTLRLADGQVVDTSSGREPLEFLQGHSQIVSGLEQALYGMYVGDEKNVVVQPEDGYGARNPDAFQEVPMNVFPSDIDLEPGMGLQLMDDSGELMLAFVAEVRPESVLLDFNHPLAGTILHFDVKVADLRHPTTEELEHGHVHSAGDEH